MPILYGLPSATSTPLWADLFWRGFRSLVPLAVFSGLSSATASFFSTSSSGGAASDASIKRARIGYAVAAIVTLLPLLWTKVLMQSVNDQLLLLSKDERARTKVGEEGARLLLKKWKWVNNVRAGLALVGGMGGIYTFVDGSL